MKMRNLFCVGLLCWSLLAFAKDPGPIDRINPEIGVGMVQSSEVYPFYIVNEVNLLSTGTNSDGPFAVMEVKAVFDAQRCLNTPRPDQYLVQKTFVGAGQVEVNLIGGFNKPEHDSINGICEGVDSPTYVKFNMQISKLITTDVSQTTLIFKDDSGEVVKKSIVKFENGKWSLR